MPSLSLYEDLLAPREQLGLARGSRIVYVASGELAGLRTGQAAFGADEADVAAGDGGATVLRWEVTEWSADDAKLSAQVQLDPWADYVLCCERSGGGSPPRRAAGPGIGCVLRGEVAVDGEPVTPFDAWVEPAELAGRGAFVRVLVLPADEQPEDSIAQGAVHL